jgi:hypothetical protein
VLEQCRNEDRKSMTRIIELEENFDRPAPNDVACLDNPISPGGRSHFKIRGEIRRGNDEKNVEHPGQAADSQHYALHKCLSSCPSSSLYDF